MTPSPQSTELLREAADFLNRVPIERGSVYNKLVVELLKRIDTHLAAHAAPAATPEQPDEWANAVLNDYIPKRKDMQGMPREMNDLFNECTEKERSKLRTILLKHAPQPQPTAPGDQPSGETPETTKTLKATQGMLRAAAEAPDRPFLRILSNRIR